MLESFTWQEIFAYARKHSPYYANLYQALPTDIGKVKLSAIPPVDQDSFWHANTIEKNQLLTAPMQEGVVFKSGGTTGQPKFSVFSRGEWENFTQIFGEGMSLGPWVKGDRVANLFYAGSLYASFLFIMKSLEYSSVPVLHFPFSGQADWKEVARAIKEFNINVLAGVPTSIMQLLWSQAEELKGHKIDKIFYGGEHFFTDAQEKIIQLFPGVKIYSIGYASVDAGHLGYASSDCTQTEHRVFDQTSIIEIIDEESGDHINEPEHPGKLLYTNLTRRLMPIIRYPVGDRGQWVEVGKKYLLLGRSEEGARVGPVTFNRDDLVSVLQKSSVTGQICDFQMVLERNEGRDQLTICLAAQEKDIIILQKQLSELQKILFEQRKLLKEAIDKKLIGPVLWKLVSPEKLIRNPRTGKLRFLIDNR